MCHNKLDIINKNSKKIVKNSYSIQIRNEKLKKLKVMILDLNSNSNN